MANPTKLSWTGPTRNTDGSVFDQSQFGGYQINVDSQPAVSIPVAWETDGTYDFPLASLSLAYGAHTATLQTVHKNGNASAPSNAASFSIADERVPNPPFALSAA